MTEIPPLDQLVTIRSFRDLPEALFARGKVQSAEIDCLLADDNLVRMNWLWSNAIGGVRLQVRLQDADDARAVLDDPTPEELTDETLIEPYVQPHCPSCDSLDIAFEGIDRFWTFALWMVLQFPVPVRKSNWKCYSCGAEWIEQ